jgi:hypothetical protein
MTVNNNYQEAEAVAVLDKYGFVQSIMRIWKTQTITLTLTFKPQP